MTAKKTRILTFPLFLSALLVLLPALAFCATIAFGTINLPLLDDYDTILHFADGLADRPTFAGKVTLFITAQSNEYKLYVLHGVVWFVASLTHNINFRFLIALGDVFVLLLGILLWTQFLPDFTDIRRKLVYFIPVSCLLFQLRYQEAAVWSTAALQHMPCIFFSFAAIYAVRARSRAKFCMSLVCLLLAVCSSGNGFLLMPVGLLALLVDRKYVRALVWTAMAAGCVAIYFHTYTRVNLQAKQTAVSSLLQVHPTYFLLFLGSLVARPLLAPGILLGLAVCGFLTYLVFTGSLHRPTNTLYCMLYLLLTAFAVAGLRGNVNALEISTSRYTIYSALTLILCWILMLERPRSAAFDEKVSTPVLSVVVLASLLFSASTYVSGLRSIQRNNQTLRAGMRSFEHPHAGAGDPSPITPIATDSAEQKAFHDRARQELRRAIQLGLYSPPPL